MKALIIYIFLLFSTVCYSQVGIGVSVIQNFQTESTGFGLRGAVYGRKVNVVPQISYYPSF